MSTMLQLVFTALAGSMLLACTNGNPLASGDPEATRGASASEPLPQTPRNQAFTVRSGASFSVVLPSSGGGGYQWSLADEGFDSRVVRLKGKRTGALPAQPMPGKFADEIFDFEGVASGKTTLIFQLYREWEGPSRAVETRSHAVTVQ